ncbi:MAG: energy transducer TonB, partial [Acidobacteria bacterium]|nr:energy transducer TonB [Acidobacteriota bacterium]
GKIYTIFFPMPGKSWTLEYCLLDSPARNPALSQRGGMVQLDQGLVPPYVLERFDFQRIPIPDDKANKLIILHGLIRQDGSVGELSILQDVEPRMDEAALAAFRRWRFMPALRGGEAVAVEILVGIPARIPQASANK